jgi:hypothetical protein
MKKAILVLAVIVMNMGMYSCTNDSGSEDQALYENLNTNSGDGDHVPIGKGSGGN